MVDVQAGQPVVAHEGYRFIKDLPDGRRVWTHRRPFNTQIIVGLPSLMCYDDAW